MTTKKKTITTTLRIPEDMHERAANASEELHIPLNSFVLQAIGEKLKRSEWLDQREADDGK